MLASAFFYPAIVFTCFKLNFCYQNYYPLNKEIQMDFLLMEGDELEKIDYTNIHFFYLLGIYLDNANYS